MPVSEVRLLHTHLQGGACPGLTQSAKLLFFLCLSTVLLEMQTQTWLFWARLASRTFQALSPGAGSVTPARVSSQEEGSDGELLILVSVDLSSGKPTWQNMARGPAACAALWVGAQLCD